MAAIMDTAKESALTLKSGGGAGYTFSILRPKKSLIKTSKQQSSGVVSFMKIYDSTCGTIQAGGSRRGAQMGILGVWHPDIEDFIYAKQDGSLNNFNLSVFVTDEFMQAVENDDDWTLIFPDTSFEKYDDEWDGNIKTWQDKGYPVNQYKTIKARQLFDKIIKSNYDYAEPGIIFEDRMNKNNPLHYAEYIAATNPCFAAGTMVMTKEGHYPIEDLIGKNVEIWDGEQWVFVDNFRVTAENQEVFEIEMYSGATIKATKYHNFILENGDTVQMKDLRLGDCLYSTLNMKEEIKTLRYIGIEEKVYCCTVPTNNQFTLSNGILVGNCGEEGLAPYGSCNLGAINISQFVKNPFTDNAKIDFDEMKQCVKYMTVMLDRILDINYYPLDEQREQINKKRQIGIGITGLADALAMLKLKYSSQEARDIAGTIMKFITNTGYLVSADLAEIFSSFELYDEEKFLSGEYVNSAIDKETLDVIKAKGLRNSRLTTIAPTGTISLLMNNVSGGMEPFFALEYNRKVKQEDGSETTQLIENYAWSKYKEKFGGDETPDYFETTENLTVENHIDMQSELQKFVCASISKTINIPADYDYEKFKNVYIDAWKKNLKGCTTYRPNLILGSVLSTKEKKEQDDFYEIWKSHETGKVIFDDVTLPDEYPMYGYKIKSEGKKWYVHCCFKDKSMKHIFAMFIQTNSREPDINTFDIIDRLEKLAIDEGVSIDLINKNRKKMIPQTNVTKIARTISMLFRHNIKLDKIIDVLDSIDVPVSSFIYRIKKFLLGFVDDGDTTNKVCPSCNETLVFKEGCKSCLSCGWSKC
jgi:ribonucleotide reductase alpha subunit